MSSVVPLHDSVISTKAGSLLCHESSVVLFDDN